MNKQYRTKPCHRTGKLTVKNTLIGSARFCAAPRLKYYRAQHALSMHLPTHGHPHLKPQSISCRVLRAVTGAALCSVLRGPAPRLLRR